MSFFGRVRDYLRPVNRPPAGGRRDAWVHHGFRAAMVAVIALAVPLMFPQLTPSGFDGIDPGSVARQTINADFDFDVPKDPDRLAEEQDEAEAGVTPRLRFEPARADSSIERVNALFARLDSIIPAAEARVSEEGLPAAAGAAVVRDEVRRVAGGIGVDLSAEAVIDSLRVDYLLDEASRAELRDELATAFEGLREGVIRGSELDDISAANVVAREGPAGDDRVRAVADLVRLGDFTRAAREGVGDRLPAGGAALFQQLLLVAQPTLRIDQDATRQAREQARAAIPQVEGFVLEGERIITENTVVTEEEYRRLLAYQAQILERGGTRTTSDFLRNLGMILLVVSMLGILVFATFRFRRDVYEDLPSFTVLLGLVVIVMASAGAVAAAQGSPALVPIALAGFLAAALFDSLLGLVVVSTIAGILMGQPYFSGLAAPMVTVAGGVTAAFAVHTIRTRSQSWVLVALITAAYVGAGLLLVLTGHFALGEMGTTAALGFLNATVCTGLGVGIGLPLLEAFTGRTTEASLLELSDMNRPLLRRLAREAPGTYAHSINVANLVEAACEAIGADSLQGRVGVYYHDIGKLERPQYFIENQPRGLNPHDRLTPWQSAEILRDHVRHGLAMAEEARLPEVVKDFIREHHGTQLIRYFLEKARRDGVAEVDPSDFAYPGPKPQSKETGVAMLADAVEAASRVLSHPSPERIRALIDRLVQDRIDYGELDDCPLTYRDLRIVKREFAHVLTGLYHHRIDYPQPAAPGETSGDAGETPAGEESETSGVEAAATAGAEGASAPIDLEQAAQGDTGPIPALDSLPEPAEEPEGVASGRTD
ncbi:HDIG domain-containing metalloprotein [Candidatus Palauibacter polyketidifaciens]|uniref:HD family phosphohydrolase n=1 Tax=Candidatus Palauibacter polyketidifaciens TaxID=3056740 RepID=UPI0023874A3E|nr:HDIG domain-containing metalloprotein [Candidatus Palauibacter polyketidifaciens]MDE2721270.1 HDIG domain-containing protein [Candidatus Palauibacter polyketidifaciens]